jgi:invasion protein IalB
MRLERRIVAALVAGLALISTAALADDATPAAPAATPAATAPAAAMPATPAAAAAPIAAAPIAAAPAAAPATAALAATPPAATVPDAVQAWAKFCDPDPKGKVICLVRKLVFDKTNIIGSVTLRIDPTKGVPVLAVAAVPVGVVLRPGLRWQVDTAKPVALPYWRCTPQSCESEQFVRPDFIKRLRNGKTLTLTAKDVNNRDFAVKVSLSGFASAFDKKNAPTFAEYTKSLPQPLAQ